MRGKIDELEAELLRERPWALRGEVAAKDRPENSLLEAALDVERATRVAPAITVEATASLEDVIRQRILEDKFDDVAPKNIELSAKPREDAPEVSMDKSTEGLAAVYEKEYLKQALGVEEDDPSKDLKEELRRDFARLCGKLDALCNFHFRPRAHLPEVAVATDVPAIAMEEALPTGVSTADGLAPEEVYARKRGRRAVFLEGGAEMDQDERNRARLAKKRSRNKARKQTEAEQKLVSRANPGLGNPYEQRKLLADIRGARNVMEGAADARTGKDFSTSTKFFGALQKQVAKGVKDAAAAAVAGADGGGGGAEKRSNRGAALRL
ncbi:Mpp10 protein-domain-containing protein [Tribonema minus]|uniref:Mpp10 protein-domain-containing protein n=1 Tax=Tribonema minus TaxID=303371 RepID=A0A835YNW6_9STRA|nr:Mpp10 protein-domain-containing protein [Tribonema minus]